MLWWWHDMIWHGMMMRMHGSWWMMTHDIVMICKHGEAVVSNCCSCLQRCHLKSSFPKFSEYVRWQRCKQLPSWKISSSSYHVHHLHHYHQHTIPYHHVIPYRHQTHIMPICTCLHITNTIILISITITIIVTIIIVSSYHHYHHDHLHYIPFTIIINTNTIFRYQWNNGWYIQP